MKPIVVMLLLAALTASTSAYAGNPRKEVHDKYIATLWTFLQDSDYVNWKAADGFSGIGVGPRVGQKTYAWQEGEWAEGSIVVSEHWDGEELAGLSLYLKQKPGYSQKNRDWYWVQFGADGTVVSASPDKEAHRKPGFVTWEVDGRLWVFNLTSVDAADFVRSGELAKSVTRVGAGPGGMTIRSGDADTIDAYLAGRPGFDTFIVDGRLWVLQPGSDAYAEFLKSGEPGKSVTRVGAGPNGMTIRSGDSETIDAYLAQRKGFETFLVDGRLWVFKTGAEELAEFRAHGEPAKSVTRVGAGPNGMTIRSGDSETIDAYLAAKDGFETFIVEGRLWVFREGAEELSEFKQFGEPAKSVTRVGAGPNGMTIRSVDGATIDAYLQ
ncbi:MAG: hypothetical protein ACYTGL_08105 [Planctomycetota bacterium]|jgi:hypothetical protein